MTNYQLIAFDMDGTLLNSEKQVTPKTLQAIHEAVAAGKYIALNTGRGPAELEAFRNILADVHYLNCISGALVRDVPKNVTVSASLIDADLCLEMMDVALQEDVMIQMITEKSFVQRDKIEMMPHYHMSAYQNQYRENSTPMDDMSAEYRADPFPMSKFNIYHADPEARDRTYQRFLAAGFPLQMVFAEETSLECSPCGVHKGTGLLKLCDYLGIGIEQCIAVGDADNDLLALQTAGLAVAMGNANENVKRICPVTVADNNHDGCAEAIYRCLLGQSEQ